MKYSASKLKRWKIVQRLFLITCILVVLYLFCIMTIDKKYLVDDKIVNEALENLAKNSEYIDVIRKSASGDVKYLLLWNSYYGFTEEGRKDFFKNNCLDTNCYVTLDRYLLNGDITKFDAIAFNGDNVASYHYFLTSLPKYRSLKQKYLFLQMESSDNYPVCDPIFDDFFNWTVTYKFDSDIPFKNILVENKYNHSIIGPDMNVQWVESGENVDDNLLEIIRRKSKAAAWFVSNCQTRSKREEYVDKLKTALAKNNHTVDIYGKCGDKKCPPGESDCDKLLETEYYFYLAFENSFSDDYVTEKLVRPLENYAVPIVYGGANYSRFLPPGSYLNAREYSPEDLAEEMVRIISSPKEYQQFFKWKPHYKFYDPQWGRICGVCEALNNQSKLEQITTYPEFRKWWNPDYVKRCR